MNSFELDLKRAFFSKGFGIAVICNIVILFMAGFDSDIYRVSVPVLGSLPYASAWITDYESGFLRFYLQRTDIGSYIAGKILACGISGGCVGLTGILIYIYVKQTEGISALLVFACGMLWSMVAALLAALTNNRYMAHGGAFVICYLLVIVQERYFKSLYCINPNEWLRPEHIWVFEENGVILMITAIMSVVFLIYYEVVKRRIING